MPQATDGTRGRVCGHCGRIWPDQVYYGKTRSAGKHKIIRISGRSVLVKQGKNWTWIICPACLAVEIRNFMKIYDSIDATLTSIDKFEYHEYGDLVNVLLEMVVCIQPNESSDHSHVARNPLKLFMATAELIASGNRCMKTLSNQFLEELRQCSGIVDETQQHYLNAIVARSTEALSLYTNISSNE